MLRFDQFQKVLKKAFPNSTEKKRADYAAPLYRTLVEFNITTPKRIAAFLANIGVESGELRYSEEIWGPTKQQSRYDQPGTLATWLGNHEPGDGYKFRGRGLIQLTGRTNYKNASKDLLGDASRLLERPDLVSEADLGSRIAGWFWDEKGLNDYADNDDLETITRRINGGLTHHDRRVTYYDTIVRAVHEILAAE